MAGLSQEDIAAVAGAWAAIGGRARRQIEWESLESSGFCILHKGLVCLPSWHGSKCIWVWKALSQLLEGDKISTAPATTQAHSWQARELETRLGKIFAHVNLWRSKTPSRLHCLCKRSNMQWKAVVRQGLASSDAMGPGSSLVDRGHPWWSQGVFSCRSYMIWDDSDSLGWGFWLPKGIFKTRCDSWIVISVWFPRQPVPWNEKLAPSLACLVFSGMRSYIPDTWTTVKTRGRRQTRNCYCRNCMLGPTYVRVVQIEVLLRKTN